MMALRQVRGGICNEGHVCHQHKSLCHHSLLNTSPPAVTIRGHTRSLKLRAELRSVGLAPWMPDANQQNAELLPFPNLGLEFLPRDTPADRPASGCLGGLRREPRGAPPPPWQN